MNIASKAFAALALCTLTACGGGGDGGSSASDPGRNLAALDSTNVDAVASAALTASLEGGDLGSLALPASQSAITSSPTTRMLAKVGELQSAQTSALLAHDTAGTVQAMVGPATADCDAGGTLTVQGDIANQQSLSSGDTLTITLTDCNDGSAVTNGTLELTVTSFSGDFASGMYVLGVTLRLIGFEVVEGGETVTAQGDISLDLDTRSPPVRSATIASSSLTLGKQGETVGLSDFSVTRTFDETTLAYSVDAAGTITSSAFDGAVSFETTQTFDGTGAAPPTAGELLVMGAAGATLRVTVLSGGTSLRLELDADGDGVVDESRDESWDSLT